MDRMKRMVDNINFMDEKMHNFIQRTESFGLFPPGTADLYDKTSTKAARFIFIKSVFPQLFSLTICIHEFIVEHKEVEQQEAQLKQWIESGMALLKHYAKTEPSETDKQLVLEDGLKIASNFGVQNAADWMVVLQSLKNIECDPDKKNKWITEVLIPYFAMFVDLTLNSAEVKPGIFGNRETAKNMAEALFKALTNSDDPLIQRLRELATAKQLDLQCSKD